MIDDFMKELQDLCKKHSMEIYPGYIDETEEGIIVLDTDHADTYSLVECNRHQLKFNKTY